MPHQIARSTLLAFALLLLGGCATEPPEPQESPLVYPPPPAEPRFVFERTLRFSTNVETLSTADKLKQVATGEPTDIRGLVKPFDVAAHGGRVYVTDTVQKNVVLFDIAGGRYKEFGLEDPGAIAKPLGIDTDDTGKVYVMDAGNKRVMVYDADGTFLRSIGTPDRFERPADVAVDTARDRLYIVETGGVDSPNHGVHVFALGSGEWIASWLGRGAREGEFNLPLQAAVAPNGDLYVVDSGNFRVVVLSPEGKMRRTFGTLGRYPGQFARPKGISIDSEGRVYVVDTAFGNVQIFTATGDLLMFIGQRGQSSRAGNYMLPSGVDVDESGRVYIVDQFFRKTDVYKPWGLDDRENAAPSSVDADGQAMSP